jgi:hypothetical protein
MRQIPIASSMLVYLDELEFTEAALAADPDAADLAPHFQAEIESWDGVFAVERAGRRKVVRADAVVAVCNTTLDTTTTRFGGAVLLEAGQDRKSPLFRRFFKTSASVLVRTALRKQCEYTRNVILVELAKVDPKSPLKSFAVEPENRAKAALDSLDARAKAKGERATSSHEVEEWKEGVNCLRTTTHGELVKRAATHGFGRAWPNTFFRTPGAAEEETDEVPETPVPPRSPQPPS